MLQKLEVEALNKYRKSCRIPYLNNLCINLLDTHKDMELYPICVPSYNVNPKRKLIYNLIKEEIPFTVYAYSDQVDRYKEIGCTDIFEIDPRVREQKYPLSNKLNIILNNARKNGWKRIFRLDDDLGETKLPHYVASNNSIRLMNMPLNVCFHIWQMTTDLFDVDYSSLPPCNMVRDSVAQIQNGLLFDYYNVTSGFVLLSVTNLDYDTSIGWEDADMVLRMVKNGYKYGAFLAVASTGQDTKTSVMDYHNNFKDTFERTAQLANRYGLDVIEPYYNERTRECHAKINLCVFYKNLGI